MDITIYPRKLSGTVAAIPSKSQAHRMLICAAFADDPVTIQCSSTNADMDATTDCLRSIGAEIHYSQNEYYVKPVRNTPKSADLFCKESGSTLRFLLPVCAALGIDTTFHLEGRLPYRPLSPLWEELERMGVRLSRPTENTIRCSGKLRSGIYNIDGSVSSQYITGLLLALTLLPGKNKLNVTGNIESRPYIRMTEETLQLFGINTENYHFHNNILRSPGTISVEGDWSNAAFFLGAHALGNDITITGLNYSSSQGDREVVNLIKRLNDCSTISGCDTPDLIPVLAVIAGAKKGAHFENIGRLRLKESDRIESIAAMMRALGAKVESATDSLTISPSRYHSCIIDSCNDHRIAMAAAIASTVADGSVTILGADCVAKSYPDFWSEFTKLGGYYEQYNR